MYEFWMSLHVAALFVIRDVMVPLTEDEWLWLTPEQRAERRAFIAALPSPWEPTCGGINAALPGVHWEAAHEEACNAADAVRPYVEGDSFVDWGASCSECDAPRTYECGCDAVDIPF